MTIAEPRIVRRWRNAFQGVAHAPRAITACSARTDPDGVSTTAGAPTDFPLPNRVTGVCSKIRTPRRIRALRSPRASRAGWTVAASEISIPPPSSGESHRSRTWSARSSRYSSAKPSAAPASIVAVQRPSIAGFVATARSPPGVNHAATSLAAHHSPIARGERPTWSSSSRASFSPKVETRSVTCPHQPSQKPPLRPLGPPPQMSCSTSTTSSPGSRSVRNHAVHIPV
jgi:hypothetical protein